MACPRLGHLIFKLAFWDGPQCIAQVRVGYKGVARKGGSRVVIPSFQKGRKMKVAVASVLRAAEFIVFLWALVIDRVAN